MVILCEWVCGVCGAICPERAIDYALGKLIIDPDKCSTCLHCVQACPLGVLKEEDIARL